MATMGYLWCSNITISVLEWLEFDSNSSANITDFYYYFITLIGIAFGVRFSLEWGTVFYY